MSRYLPIYARTSIYSPLLLIHFLISPPPSPHITPRHVRLQWVETPRVLSMILTHINPTSPPLPPPLHPPPPRHVYLQWVELIQNKVKERCGL